MTKMGGYELPISISYHASGAGVTDIPTSVGLGWTLNAGGAITRTILGQPDFFRYDAASFDYRLFDYDYISELKENKQYGEFWEITHSNVDYNTESDRYCFNIGNHTGVFRYSYQDRDFFVLDHSAYHIEQSGAGLNSEFRLYCPDNTEYVFSEQEGAGVDPPGEGNPYTAAWYVSEAITPWGTVEFTYRHGVQLDIRSNHQQTFVGMIVEPDISGIPEMINRVRRQNYSSNYTYEQTLIEKIVWNGNSIQFEYEPYGDGIYTDRLVKMTVKDNAENLIKQVKFGNNDYWLSSPISDSASLDIRIGRRMLSSLEDTQNGNYQFSYNRTMTIPSYDGIEAAKWSDLWGYYRGERNTFDLTYKVVDRLLSIASSDSAYLPRLYSDRSPVLDATKAGVLNEIVFLTGGRARFNFELTNASSG